MDRDQIHYHNIDFESDKWVYIEKILNEKWKDPESLDVSNYQYLTRSLKSLKVRNRKIR